MHQYVILATEIEARRVGGCVDADLCMNNSGPSRGYCVCCRHKQVITRQILSTNKGPGFLSAFWGEKYG